MHLHLEQQLIVILYNMVTDAPMCQIPGSKPETKAQSAPNSVLCTIHLNNLNIYHRFTVYETSEFDK